MAVILKSIMCGPRGSFQAGQQAEFDAQTERELVQGGYAEYLTPPAPVERAVVAPAVEHAVAPQQPNPVAPTRPETRNPRRGR